MGLNCGIVGLPNVGKSTLFNALTQTAIAEAANYPFCTIEPNIGCVGVPDDRLEKLAFIAKSKKIIHSQVEFVDIAGLVKGASKGEGLGNQFLGHIRSTDAIIQVLRCFDNDDISHVEGNVNPLRDIEIIETELALSDIESLQKRIERLSKKINNMPQDEKKIFLLMEEALGLLNSGEGIRGKNDQKSKFVELGLLSDKPLLYVCNVAEEEAVKGNQYTELVQDYANKKCLAFEIISAEIEAQIASLSSQKEKVEFLQSLNLNEPGLTKVIKAVYSLLGLETFFTVGPQEARAWSILKNSKAPDAAAEIHTDFKKGFICAATISYEDFVKYEGELGAKNAGRLRLEGRDYVVQDGDVIHFRFNV